MKYKVYDIESGTIVPDADLATKPNRAFVSVSGKPLDSDRYIEIPYTGWRDNDGRELALGDVIGGSGRYYLIKMGKVSIEMVTPGGEVCPVETNGFYLENVQGVPWFPAIKDGQSNLSEMEWLGNIFTRGLEPLDVVNCIFCDRKEIRREAKAKPKTARKTEVLLSRIHSDVAELIKIDQEQAKPYLADALSKMHGAEGWGCNKCQSKEVDLK